MHALCHSRGVPGTGEVRAGVGIVAEAGRFNNLSPGFWMSRNASPGSVEQVNTQLPFNECIGRLISTSEND